MRQPVGFSDISEFPKHSGQIVQCNDCMIGWLKKLICRCQSHGDSFFVLRSPALHQDNP